MGEFIKLSLLRHLNTISLSRLSEKLSITFYYFLKLSEPSEKRDYISHIFMICVTLHGRQMKAAQRIVLA